MEEVPAQEHKIDLEKGATSCLRLVGSDRPLMDASRTKHGKATVQSSSKSARIWAHIIPFCAVEDLLKCDERVVLSYFVLLPDALVHAHVYIQSRFH